MHERNAIGSRIASLVAIVFVVWSGAFRPRDALGQSVERANLTASLSPRQFGTSLATSGDYVAVGGTDAILVYRKPLGGWDDATEVARLVASDGTIGLHKSVAIDGNTIVAVGRTSAQQAALYVFERPSTGWRNATEDVRLLPRQASTIYSVALDGRFIVSGATNSTRAVAHVFERPVNQRWASAVEIAQLTASDGLNDDNFGFAIALSGNTVVVGAQRAQGPPTARSGALYVFERPSTGWRTGTETAKLTASDGSGFAYLGASVAIGTNTVFGGAPRTKVGTNANAGSAYAFVRPTGGWINATETAKFVPSDPGSSHQMGTAISAGDGWLFCGAPGGVTGGALYEFLRPATGWASGSERWKLVQRSTVPGTRLGTHVAMGTDAVLTTRGPDQHAQAAVTVFGVADLRASGTTRPGGTVRFALNAPGEAGLPYQVASSLGLGRIPLAPNRSMDLSFVDPLFALSIQGGLPLFRRYVGMLDAQGRAIAELSIPAGAGLVGLEFFTAFITVRLPNARVGVISDPAPVTIRR